MCASQPAAAGRLHPRSCCLQLCDGAAGAVSVPSVLSLHPPRPASEHSVLKVHPASAAVAAGQLSCLAIVSRRWSRWCASRACMRSDSCLIADSAQAASSMLCLLGPLSASGRVCLLWSLSQCVCAHMR